MDAALIDRIRRDMRYEFARTAPPDGFPAFHDIPTARHTSDEFHELEQQHPVAEHVGDRRPRRGRPDTR